MSLLDALAVLLLAVGVDMLLLWLAGHFASINPFSDVPGDIKSFVEGTKGLVLAGGSALAGVLLGVFRRWAQGQSGRNYLLQLGVTAAVLLVVVVGLARLMQRPQLENRPEKALLRLTMSPAMESIAFIQKEPEAGSCHYLSPAPSRSFEEEISLPRTGRRFLALVNERVLESEQSEAARQEAMAICLTPAESPPNAAALVDLDCVFPKGCTPTIRDPGWLKPCATPGTGLLLGILGGQAHAAEGGASSAGWRVPTLETLEKQHQRGYTVFDLWLAPAPTLSGADAMTYGVRVNGTQVFFDGWAPDDLRLPYDPSQRAQLRFGLENLNFYGAEGGFEKIELRLVFWQGSKKLREVAFEQPYCALRNMSERQVVQDGLILDWQGTYVKKRQEERFEVFLLSTPSATAASAAKTRFDRLAASMGSRRVLGVVRPPLEGNSYGVVVGVERPSKQVDFTFDEARAREVCSFVLGLRKEAAGAAAIHPSAYRYELSTRKVKPCGQLP
jgi:hypothetical protein